MKKHFVFLFVIAVLIILFGSGNIFAQSPSWAPEPGTMEYIEWFQTQVHPDFSSSGNGWFESSPSGFGDSTFNAAGIVTGTPVPAWAPEPGTMAYIEWLMATQGHPYSSYFGGSSPGTGDWFYNMDSPSGFVD